jgi:uroporphyrinogen decarboxylase
VTLPLEHPLTDGRTNRSGVVRAFRGDRPTVPPVWFMRQAGRSLPEYRAVRKGVAMLDACLDPAVASEITLQPVRRHHVDAAIFFSDIVVPLRLAGVDVDIAPGVGPVLGEPLHDRRDVDRLLSRTRALNPAVLAPISDAVTRTVAALGTTPLIGFAGAPFTLAAYLVEGGPSRDHLGARRLMHTDPGAWTALTNWAADLTGEFLRAQVVAGASAIQLFDSWAGSLSLADYTAHVAAASTRALSRVRDLGVPIVHFGTATGHLLEAMRDVGADVVGVDHRTPLDEADRILGGRTPLQGNLDPALLAAPWPVVEAAVRDMVARGAQAPGHVVNLGHGVPPDTDPAVLTRIVELVHSLT